MLKIFVGSTLSLSLVLSLGLQMAQASFVAPTRAILYPSGGLLEVKATLPVKDGQIGFSLPQGVAIDTLNIYLENVSNYSQSATMLPAVESLDLAPLRKDLDEATQAFNTIRAELKLTQAQLELWSNSKLTSFSDLAKMDAAILNNVKTLQLRAITLNTQSKVAKAKVDRLTKVLQTAGGKVAEVMHINLTVDTKQPTVNVVYSYIYPQCGWEPVYRFNALPEAGQVEFWQSATLWQNMGVNWATTQVNLASAALSSDLQPAELATWILRPSQGIMPRAARMEAMPLAAMDMSAKTLNAMPVVMEKETLSLWELGQVRLITGQKNYIQLHKGTWQADFVRILRPSRQSSAFVQASVKLPEALDLPSGQAQYLLAGIPVGKSQFGLVGDETKLYFGQDVRVSAEMSLDTRQSGKQGFVDKKQTRVWKWNIVVSNQHTTPMQVLVEDPEPRSYDTAIELKITANPKAEVKDQVQTWALTVPAQKKVDIDYMVEARAPAEMKLDDGR